MHFQWLIIDRYTLELVRHSPYIVAGDHTPVCHCYATDLSYNADYIHVDSNGHRMLMLKPRWAPRWAHIL